MWISEALTVRSVIKVMIVHRPPGALSHSTLGLQRLSVLSGWWPQMTPQPDIKVCLHLSPKPPGFQPGLLAGASGSLSEVRGKSLISTISINLPTCVWDTGGIIVCLPPLLDTVVWSVYMRFPACHSILKQTAWIIYTQGLAHSRYSINTESITCSESSLPPHHTAKSPRHKSTVLSTYSLKSYFFPLT